MLEKLKERLVCGYIKANSQSDKTDKSLAFVVRDLSSLRDTEDFRYCLFNEYSKKESIQRANLEIIPHLESSQAIRQIPRRSKELCGKDMVGPH